MGKRRSFTGRVIPLTQSGVTMVEVLIAMIVLSLGILALAPMMVVSITSTHSSNQVTTLAAAAQQRIEDLVGTSDFPDVPYIHTESLEDSLYTVVTQINDHSVDASIPERVYELSVAVHWQDDADIRRSLSFVTYANKR